MSAHPPLKYEAVAGELLPCLPTMQELHLRAFAEAFIQKDLVARWIHSLIEKPTKARTCLSKFHNHHNERLCKMISGTDTWPHPLANRFGSNYGVYFTGAGSASLTTIGYAASLDREAIFSLQPGRVAVFFHHEGWAWVCSA